MRAVDKYDFIRAVRKQIVDLPIEDLDRRAKDMKHIIDQLVKQEKIYDKEGLRAPSKKEK